MLRRERYVFFTIVGAAVAIVLSVKMGNPTMSRLLHIPLPPQRVLGPVLTAIPVDPAPTASPQLVLNPALIATPQISPTPTPGALAHPVCAMYYRRSPSTGFVQGSWTDSAEATQSLQACYDWMARAVLPKAPCAEPGTTDIMVVLLDNSRHAFDLPDNLNMDTEFVMQQECP